MKREADDLSSWLVQQAYPCWYSCGVDHARGGFHESLRLDGQPSGETRRARLYPRQIYAFSVAGKLGWSGPVADVVRQGLAALCDDYRRPDGLYRSLVAPNGTPLVERAVLYDQAFVLLGFASAHRALSEPSARDEARSLLARIEATLRNPHGGFEESAPRTLPLLANSHMHLLEACLEWADLDDERWSRIAAEIVELALQRFRDPASGFIREFFVGDWKLATGDDADVVEPGHQYEWAWLLLRWSQRARNPRAFQLALDLIDRAEARGVDSKRGVALNSLFGDGRVRDARARLWPQTERIKATCLAGRITGQTRYNDIAAAATRSLLRYLATPTPGLWRDIMDERGAFAEQFAPATSFYHIVSAVLQLTDARLNTASS
ncbi:MAG TPA: AGE family epimerase/isomerase [Steroidobacteraceae bacterium]|nr:AGE family epimerase/isomerase [Steroidobacteraceae bacterium]